MTDRLDVSTRTAEAVSRFLKASPLEQATLTLDGTGVNGALQYRVLSAIGADRLEKLGHVNVISASTYAYLCFLAHARGSMTWSEERAGQWDRFNRRCHGISPVASAVKLGVDMARGRRGSLDGSGFVEALRGTVDADFFALTVKDMPANVSFWLYEIDGKRLVEVTSTGELSHLPIAALIRAAPAVPQVFAPAMIDGKRYSDPVYCSLTREMYRIIRSRAGNHLFSNMRRDGAKDGTLYLKPHAHGAGDLMMGLDFAAFVAGVPNARIGGAIREGLFQAQRIEA